jgi:transposase
LDRLDEALGEKKSRGIQLAVRNMWKAFHNSTDKHAPQAAILFDKFHVIRHLNEPLDKVRKSEYARLSGKDRRFIKEQKYTLFSRRENLDTEGWSSLRTLLKANQRLSTAFLLKESFCQLWGYKNETWARKFSKNWWTTLKWQQLKSYEEFFELIESHWGGITAFIQSEEEVPLGFVEGLNNKIPVIQRRAYGVRDEEYLRLKVLTCMLPAL